MTDHMRDAAQTEKLTREGFIAEAYRRFPDVEEPIPDHPKGRIAVDRGNIRYAFIEGALYAAQPPAAPVETERKTFTIPPGYEAVRDSEGRATGEVRPQSSAESAGLANLILEYAKDLRRNSSGGDDYPWAWAKGAADYLEELVRRANLVARRDKIAAGAFYKTRGDKNNLPHIVGPLERADDGDAPWQARVHDQIWKWGYDGLANTDGSPHNRDLMERVYRPECLPGEPQPTQVSAERIASMLALSYGRDPDDLTHMTEMCDAENRPVPIWRVYEEQAEALLDVYSIAEKVLLAQPQTLSVREAE